MFGWLSWWRRRREEKQRQMLELEQRALAAEISRTLTFEDPEDQVDSILRDPLRNGLQLFSGAQRLRRIRELMRKAELLRYRVEELQLFDLPEVFRNSFQYSYSRNFSSEALEAFKDWAADNRNWLRQHLEDDVIFKARFLLWLNSRDGENWRTMVGDEVFSGPLGEILDPLIPLLKKRLEEQRYSYTGSYDHGYSYRPSPIDRDWRPGGGGGRESTSKGSIGHDRLNVKTLRPSEWRARVALVRSNLPGRSLLNQISCQA